MSDFPQTLKAWRMARRVSQLELAMRADVSTRHLSFLETGRAQPSREMISRLGDALQLPLHARNAMLTNAGFAARYAGRQWTSDEMAPIRQSLELMLNNHMPFPGLAVDRLWTLRVMNPAPIKLYEPFGVGIGDSLLDLMMSEAVSHAMENWPDVARHVASRLRTESVAQGGVAQLDRVVAHLAKVACPTEPATGPVVPTILRFGDERLAIFSTISQFGTPEDVTLDDFKIELFFPMDARSEQILRELARS